MKQKRLARLTAIVLSGALLMGNTVVPSAMEGEQAQESSAEDLILEDAQAQETPDESDALPDGAEDTGNAHSGAPEDTTVSGAVFEIESIETAVYRAESDPQAPSDNQTENDPQAPAVSDVREVKKEEARIALGAQQVLKFTLPETVEVSWRSSDEAIAECGKTAVQAGETEGAQEYSCMIAGLKTGICTVEAYNATDDTVYAAFEVSVLPNRVTGCIGTEISFTIVSGTLQEFEFTCTEEDTLVNPDMEEVTSVKDGGQMIHTYRYHIEARKLYDGVLTATGQGDAREIPISVTVNSHSWNETPTVEQEATCSKPGIQRIYCSACGAVKEGSEQEIPCIPHSWNAEFTVEQEATCSEEGRQNIHCSVCDAVKEGSETAITKKPHTWKAERMTDKAATCTENGISSIHCKDCDAVKDGSQELIPATGHLWDDWKQIAAPAIKTEGKDQRVCVRCNASETRSTGKLPLALEKVKMNTPVVVSGDHIKISWQAVDYAEGYVVYRKSGSRWLKVATLEGNVLEYTDKGTKIGITYSYSVRGYVTVNEKTVYSPSLKPGVSIEQKFYKDPVKMKSAQALSTKSIKIRWTGRKKSSGYIIYRKIPGKSWEKLATVGKVTSYTDKTCDSATTYQYVVRAYTENGKKTLYSKRETIGAAAVSKMHRPKLTVKCSDEESAVLTWSKQSNVGGYVIYRKEGSKGKWVKIKRTSAKTSTFTDEDVEVGKTYYYIVKAYKKAKPKVGITDPVYSNYYKKKVKIK